MSAGYGYVTMQFKNEGNKSNPELAKEIFDYCRENYGFFNSEEDDWKEYGDCFKLENEMIYPCYKGDGLDIKHIDEDIDEDFFQEIFDKFHPFDMRVEFIQDFSETSYDDNSVAYYKVIVEIGNRVLSCVRAFDLVKGSKFAYGDECFDIYDSYDFEKDDDYLYRLQEGNYWKRAEDSIIAENKKTHRVIELYDAVALEEETDDDYDDHDCLMYRDLSKNGDYFSFHDEDDEDDIFGIFDFEGRLEELGIKLEEGESSDPDEWEVKIKYSDKESFWA